MFGKNLKYYRLKKNLSMKALADKVGVSNMAISNYESGKRTPDIMILRKLAEALGIQVMDFMTISKKPVKILFQGFIQILLLIF